MLLLLCAHPTLLLLDEPSNDLDLSALDFLERFICTCGLPVIYISHDETLLSRTATRVRIWSLRITKRSRAGRWPTFPTMNTCPAERSSYPCRKAGRR